jgi:hypothetical protein
MTRHDLTPVLDDEDGWHPDPYTGPRPMVLKHTQRTRLNWELPLVIALTSAFWIAVFYGVRRFIA